MLDDVTKLLSGVMSHLALQGDGPLREPSPRQQGVLCAVDNSTLSANTTVKFFFFMSVVMKLC
ncbi:hypothetical protein EW514_23930 [Salmonella enterica subsp. enterica serovar Napoli]|nr:hypothetical protein [Salmonella enterica subsp. enterica serovar Napoli]EDA3541957.1 hypothetical protein [Salmonella enterica subsp. enterica serovar Napoli]